MRKTTRRHDVPGAFSGGADNTPANTTDDVGNVGDAARKTISGGLSEPAAISGADGLDGGRGTDAGRGGRDDVDDGGNKASEIINGVVETVDVSKHPEPTIASSDLSLADIERGRSHPVQWGVFLAAVLVAIIVPYWFGRSLASHHTQRVVHFFDELTPQGVALVSWTVTVLAFTAFAMTLVYTGRWFWRVLFVVGLACEQFIGGLCLLRFDFWYATYVVYGQSAGLANAANFGIIAAGFGVAVYAVLFVGLLVLIRKDSPLNVLTRSWVSFTMFFGIELIALCIVLFGGLLAAV